MKAIINNTPLSQAISKFENKTLTKFKPDKRFYEHVGINRIRFWQLVRGDKPILGTEIRPLSNYFNVDVNEII